MEREQGKSIGKKIHKDCDEIRQFCSTYKRIHLYGMGYVANMIYEYLKEEGISVCDVIVGEGHRERDYFKGNYRVYELPEIEFSAVDGIILCVRAELQNEIMTDIKKCGLKEEQIYGQKIYLNSVLPEIISDAYIKKININKEIYFNKYVELDNLGKTLGTDKCSKEHNYLNKYEFFLNRWKAEEVIVLELGIYQGASLKMWGEYFEKGIVYGVDIDSTCVRYEQKNCKVLIRDLGDESVLEEIARLSPDIIIDDASHLWSHQIKAMCHLLPALKSGGIFIMEDLGTSFSAYRNMNYADAAFSAYDFCSAIAEVVSSGEFLRTVHLQAIMMPVKEEIEYLANQIAMISFIRESCIIVKK